MSIQPKAQDFLEIVLRAQQQIGSRGTKKLTKRSSYQLNPKSWANYVVIVDSSRVRDRRS